MYYSFYEYALLCIRDNFSGIKLILLIYVAVNYYAIFVKANKPGWAAFVPIYNTYIMSDIVFGNFKYFVAIILLNILSIIGGYIDSTIIFLLVNPTLIVLKIIFNGRLAKAFGKSSEFTVCMMLAAIIFLPILAFGKSIYIGPQKFKSS
ncbi:DUF5684 domain-containing protein [Lacrimispora sp.]|uniref:DUF5684 domain-containing protein n=1 Tax=Lacrimispora sp. TaxID=2719234 RepID=UPI002864DF30|nr:DUF5684 domain-containing protein [Lacrimispora sp.]MDR7813111.1 DUF5684 domain-containing protein [Lacrimispora sp.]